MVLIFYYHKRDPNSQSDGVMKRGFRSRNCAHAPSVLAAALTEAATGRSARKESKSKPCSGEEPLKNHASHSPVDDGIAGGRGAARARVHQPAQARHRAEVP